jgi:hypothetical protein
VLYVTYSYFGSFAMIVLHGTLSVWTFVPLMLRSDGPTPSYRYRGMTTRTDTSPLRVEPRTLIPSHDAQPAAAGLTPPDYHHSIATPSVSGPAYSYSPP